jgi:hypothetical protein
MENIGEFAISRGVEAMHRISNIWLLKGIGK